MKTSELKAGDYVKNLTEKQFKQVMSYQPKRFGKYTYVEGQTDTLFMKGNFIDFPWGQSELKTELTFNEFLDRLKVTF